MPMPTQADEAAFEHAGRLAREAAILALAGAFKMQRADVETLEALSETACPTADLADLVSFGLFRERTVRA